MTRKALWFHEWFLMKSWIVSFCFVCVAGPFLNWMEGLVTQSPVIKFSSAIQSLYNARSVTQYLGSVGVRHQEVVAMVYGSNALFRVQGQPTMSLWVLAVSMLLAAFLSTFERQSTAIFTEMNSPISRRDWLRSKYELGILTLVAIVFLRTVMVEMANLASPIPFPIETIGISFLVNSALALVTFSLVFLAGLFVTNTIVAWMLGFIFLTLPLSIGAIIGFYGSPGTVIGNWTYDAEHRILPNFSPITYTDYTTSLQTNPQSWDMVSSVLHPWAIVIASIIVTMLMYFLANQMLLRTQIENLSNLFVSPLGFSLAAICSSILFGSVTAQIVSRAQGLVWVIAALGCYFGLRIAHRALGNKVSRTPESTEWQSPPGQSPA